MPDKRSRTCTSALVAQPGWLEVHELDEQGRYQLVAEVAGDEVYAAHHPFPVEICPARLLDGLRPP